MKFDTKTVKKVTVYLISVIMGIYALIGLYSLTFEYDKLKIDGYNFEQLEKAKPILESIPKDAQKFYSLKEFNKQYNADIKAIKNCYQINNNNGRFKYIFSFKLESVFYKIVYFSDVYSYPKFDMPEENVCFGKCYNATPISLRYVISNPCKD